MRRCIQTFGLYCTSHISLFLTESYSSRSYITNQSSCHQFHREEEEEESLCCHYANVIKI